MRRVLNRSLYSPGIVIGLEVERDPSNKHRVIVRHGLAFDHLGREIFVPQDVYVIAMGAPSTTKGVVFGNILVVSYREERKHPVSDGCAVAAPCAPCSGDLAWGAPTRIAADAVFEFLDSFPTDDSGRIPLAQIELSKTCEVVKVLPGVRKYAVPVKPQQAIPVSLEGEKDIDPANPKVLHFHVMGGVPESATLYLRARKFSTLYYTEQGKHNHVVTGTAAPDTHDFTHTHTVTGGKTTKNGTHKHAIWVDDGKDAPGVDSDTGDDWNDKIISDSGEHEHDLKDIALANALGPPLTHTHAITAGSDPVGVDDVPIRAPVAPATKTFALTYVDDMEVWFNGKNVTKEIRDQLEAKPGQAGKWAKLGDGTAAHQLATQDGSGEIDLMKLSVDIGLGTYRLEFRVKGGAAGGSIQYNLYVS
jgi:hypothetical protein